MSALQAHPPTPQAALDETLERLRAKADEFATLPIREKIGLLSELLERTASTAEAAVRAACRAKGLRPGTAQEAEEWLSGPLIETRHIRLTRDALLDIERSGRPWAPWDRAHVRPDGHLVVPVFPASGFDKLVFTGFTADVWFEKGLDRAAARARQASFYHRARPQGGVSLVLGAGNVASIGPLDVLHRMFAEGRVCVLKMNPVNEYLGEFIEQRFATFIERGYLAVVYGGAEVGAWLTRHPLVDDIHITGSDKTHDAIVWGPPGPEREARKREGRPVLDKPISSELGNVTPVIITPGPYNDRELRSIASNLAAMMVNNASFNCNAAKLIVMARGWPLRERLLTLLGEVLAATPTRQAYYPGAADRYRTLVGDRPGVRTFGTAAEGALPWTILPALDPQDRAERAFTMEPFCSIISEVSVGSTDPAAFLAEAVPFVNDRVWGTLSCTLVVHPSHEKDPALGPAIDRAVADLRYGAVALNHWSALAYGFCTTPWGAAPGATLEDIQSGRGWVHNTQLLEGIHKTVLRGPLVIFPKPAWFPDHKTAHRLARRMVEFEAAPAWRRLPRVVFTALRG